MAGTTGAGSVRASQRLSYENVEHSLGADASWVGQCGRPTLDGTVRGPLSRRKPGPISRLLNKAHRTKPTGRGNAGIQIIGTVTLLISSSGP